MTFERFRCGRLIQKIAWDIMDIDLHAAAPLRTLVPGLGADRDVDEASLWPLAPDMFAAELGSGRDLDGNGKGKRRITRHHGADR